MTALELAAAGYYDEVADEPDGSDGCAGGEHAGLLAYPGDPDSCEECGAAV